MKQSWKDNFLIKYPITANTDNVFFVGFLGDYSYTPISDQLLDMFWALMDMAVEKNILREDYHVYLECQYHSLRRNSPGQNFINEVKTWPRWTNVSDVLILIEC